MSKLTVNGKDCNPGKSSQQFHLNPDTPTNITVEVLSEDKSSDQKYNIMVSQRQRETQVDLTGLSIAPGTMVPPVFSPEVKVYSVSYPWVAANNVKVKATSSVASAQIMVDNTVVASGAETGDILVKADQNILIKVTSEDKENITMYTIKTDTESNGYLKALDVAGCPLDPAFNINVFAYKCEVGWGVATATVTPTADDAAAPPAPVPTIEVDGKAVESGKPSEAIAIADTTAGTALTTACKSADGRTTKTYVVTATVHPADTSLKALAIAPGTLAPAFEKATLAYTVEQPFGTKTMTVTPTAENEAQVDSITVNTKPVASGAASEAEPVPGDITIVVTGKDAAKTKTTYVIKATKTPASTDADLKEIAPLHGVLAPAFEPKTLAYTVQVPEAEMANWTVTPTVAGPGATVEVDGKPVASGAPSEVIALDPTKPVTVTIVVTAQDGTTKVTYTLAVSAQPPDDTLSALVLSAGTLTPAFAKDVTSYTIDAPEGTASTTATATTADSKATLTVQTVKTDSGKPSADIPLDATKPTAVVIEVTASDGKTKKSYTVTVTVPAPPPPPPPPPSDVSLSALALSDGDLNPAFDKAVKAYTVAEAAGTTQVTVTATTTDPKATMTVNGVATPSGQASAEIPLDATQPTTITIDITGEDGVTKDSYTLSVTVGAAPGPAPGPTPAPANALSALTVDPGPLTPAFDPATMNYNLDLPKGTTSVSITATCADATAALKINDDGATSGTPQPVTLDPGKPVTSIDIEVTPPSTRDGGGDEDSKASATRDDPQTYVISVTLGPSPSPFMLAHRGEDGKEMKEHGLRDVRRKAAAGRRARRIQPRD
eukprot:COSAG05_NODE_200_length_14421_cov_5.767840_1_plen_834_part_00